jgi:hypothetical protein
LTGTPSMRVRYVMLSLERGTGLLMMLLGDASAGVSGYGALQARSASVGVAALQFL